VLEKIRKVAYRLLLPKSAKIYPVFHISLLKKFQRAINQPYLPLPLITNECGLVMLPYQILDNRVIKQNDKTSLDVLVQWDSLCDDDNTWEEIVEFKKAYPQFNPEDKVTVKGGSNVTVALENLKGKEKFVEPINHVSEGGVHRSTRARKENAKWRDFIVEG